MCDVFEEHPTIDQEREKLWPLVKATPWLDWQILTKRDERLASNLPADWGSGYVNVWLGVSIESNEYASRADSLRLIPATVRFVSYEPALGPLDALDLSGIDWVIYGGESGPRFRPHQVEWAHDMRRRCQAAGVSFFYKQGSSLWPGRDSELNGKAIHEYPKHRLALPVLTLPVE
jgi:protein gp37